MQKRHLDTSRYFDELAATTRRYILPLIGGHVRLDGRTEVLEVGCGVGGNLLPFAEAGCRATGMDIDAGKIASAAGILKEKLRGEGGAKEEDRVRVFCRNFLETDPDRLYDLIVVRDVIEHIADKEAFLSRLHRFLRPGGMVFFAFPAWQMPFGGHQQICRSRVASRLPFMHLLPRGIYRSCLRLCGEGEGVVEELLSIQRCKTSIGPFKRLVFRTGYRIVREQLYLINPHYEAKFGLTPRRLTSLIGRIPGVRNFFSTSCFYLIQPA
jgi:SAM-dependent methyltransferase